MSRLRSRGSLGELGPGDLEMLLLRLRMKEGLEQVTLHDRREAREQRGEKGS